MTFSTPGNLNRIGSRRRALWSRRLVTCGVALLLVMPGAAYPISLSHLLRLPLEQLLRLEISGAAATPRLRSGDSAALPMIAERRGR